MLQSIEISNVSAYREERARRIKELMVAWTENALELGAELMQAAESFPLNPRKPTRPERPGFAKWAKETTGLSQSHIWNLMQVHLKFGHHRGRVQLAGKVMVLLARKDVPESARQEIIGRSERGEKISAKDAKKITQKHKLPGPKAANRQAKEEGHPVLASDGYIYFGTDPAKAKAGADRRSMVFGVRDALKHLGGIELTGRQFLDYAFPHQLWTPEEAPIIKRALRWLADLNEAWDARK